MPRVDTDQFYRDALARYGENAEGAHWHSAYHQRRRFEVLRDLLPADLSRSVLVDVGCGLGDLHRFLLERDALPDRYIGIDLVEPMVELARVRTGCEVLRLDLLVDPLPAADWYVASGSLNLLTPEETPRAIGRCYAAARRGFAFNLLKGRSGAGGRFNFVMPEQVRDWAVEFGAEVRIVEGYLSGDFSAVLTPPEG